MSEITKLYENAGVMWEERYDDCILNKEGNCDFRISCDMCDYSKEKYIYPPFTAEKQIELLDFLSKYEITIINESNTPYYMIYTHDKVGSVKANNIGELMAKYINMFLWQDLTPEEQQQAKGILE